MILTLRAHFIWWLFSKFATFYTHCNQCFSCFQSIPSVFCCAGVDHVSPFKSKCKELKAHTGNQGQSLLLLSLWASTFYSSLDSLLVLFATVCSDWDKCADKCQLNGLRCFTRSRCNLCVEVSYASSMCNWIPATYQLYFTGWIYTVLPPCTYSNSVRWSSSNVYKMMVLITV